MQEVHVFFRETTVVEHSYPLFKYHACSGITLDERFVSHVKCSHELQDWNLNWEVEWSDYTNWTKWPSVSGVKLASMITRLPLTVSQESHSISTEVLIEVKCHLQFSDRLLSTLWRAPLDALDEKLEYLFIMHALNYATIHLTQHQVPLLVFEWVVETSLGACLETLHEWSDLIHLSVWLLHHRFTCEWIDKINTR